MDRHDELMKTWNFLKEFWVLIKKYYYPPQSATDAYWHDLIEEAGMLGEKYERDSLCIRLIHAFMDYVEEKYRNGKANV